MDHEFENSIHIPAKDIIRISSKKDILLKKLKACFDINVIFAHVEFIISDSSL
ncbi:hypothetical protein ES705_26139 [subsurface metagenome]